MAKERELRRCRRFQYPDYKHLISGEGGLLTTDHPKLMARAVVLSGSYMLYERHLAEPTSEAYAEARLESPNCSGRMDNLRAAILRPQLDDLDRNVERWNVRYRTLEAGLAGFDGLGLVPRAGGGGLRRQLDPASRAWD